MGEQVDALTYLGVPMIVIACALALLFMLNVLGSIFDFYGKVWPKIINFRRRRREKKEEKEEMVKTIQECKQIIANFNAHYNADNISQRDNWMHNVDNSVQEIQKLDGKIDKLLDANTDLKNQIDQVKGNVLENEADRLRSELFDCGNRCRRKIRLHPEEMDHIRDVYTKYSEKLHKNGPGEKEFNFISDYYNNQSFPDYHQKNN